MCGIIGIYSQEPVAAQLYDGLIHLQHRGQDAAGIVTYDALTDKHFHIKRGLGLVQEIFSPEAVLQLQGQLGLGHTRYPTAGGYRLSDVQPLYINFPRPTTHTLSLRGHEVLGRGNLKPRCKDSGSPRLNAAQPRDDGGEQIQIALAHNGNLTNNAELAATFTPALTSALDSETLLQLLAKSLAQSSTAQNDSQAFFETLCASVKNLMHLAQGSYSVICLIQGKGLIAFRDPHGIRPLVFGERLAPKGKKDYLIASESSMFYSLGFQAAGDIEPGELIYIDLSGQLRRRSLNKAQFSPCIFEYVYFARPDSVINKASVYRARMNMGQNLATYWKKQYPDLVPDIVIPVPFTSNTAALAFANEIGVRYSEGLYKNPFIGRTFIMSDGKKRSRSVRNKISPQKTEIEGKTVLLLDDSLVRGTTSVEIVKMVREYGAKEIYFVLACPPIIHPCFYGIDMPTRKELIASSHSEEEIRMHLGVNKLLYLQIEDLVEAVSRESSETMTTPCMACMNGCYVTGKLTEEKIQNLELQRQKEKVKP